MVQKGLAGKAAFERVEGPGPWLPRSTGAAAAAGAKVLQKVGEPLKGSEGGGEGRSGRWECRGGGVSMHMTRGRR